MNRWLPQVPAFIFLLFVSTCFSEAKAAGFSSFLSDTIAPVIVCPPNDTVQLDTGFCSAVYNYNVMYYDDQPGVILIQAQGLASGAQFPSGATLNQFIAVDQAGNFASCSFTVMMVPVNQQYLNCKDTVHVLLDAGCTALLTPENALEGTYCSGVFTAMVDKVLPFGNGPWVIPEFGASDAGKTYGFRIVSTQTGNSCWGQMYVFDSIPPALTCQDINVSCAVEDLSTAFLRDSLGIAEAIPLVSDNCSVNLNITHFDQAQNFPCENTNDISGIVTRTWTAIDERGNSSTCSQVIYRRRMLSQVQFPADWTGNCTDSIPSPGLSGVPFINVGSRNYNLLPNSYCELEPVYEDSLVLVCPGTRQIQREWTVYDACLDLSPTNPRTHTQIIDLVDGNGPDIQCPPGITLSLDTSACVGQVAMPDWMLSDVCSVIVSYGAHWLVDTSEYTTTGTLLNFAGHLDSMLTVRAGTSAITFVAVDACGNIGTCTSMLTALDSTPPLAVCDSLVNVLLLPDGTAQVAVYALASGSNDDCSPLHIRGRRLEPGCAPTDSLWKSQLLFCCTDVGDTIDVQVRVFDLPVLETPFADTVGLGHFSDCQSRVLVENGEALNCSAPADVVVSCYDFDPSLGAYGDFGFSCAAVETVMELDYAQFDSLCPAGILLRKLHVFDSDSNELVCTQQIQVIFEQNFYVRFPDDIVANNCDSSTYSAAPEIFNQGCAGVSVSYVDELFTVVPDACFKIVRTWLVYNWCNYDPLLPVTLVPNPNPNPINNHPDNLPGPTVSEPGAAAPWTATVVRLTPFETMLTDFSSFWSATVNAYRYKQVIKVVDTGVPIFVNCAPDTLYFSGNTDNDANFWNDPAYLNGPDFCEEMVNTSVTGTDMCVGAEVNIDFILFLDIDNDGVEETQISSANNAAPGYVKYHDPISGNMIDAAFDSRAVAANQKFRFAMLTSVSGNEKMVRLVWNTEGNPFDHVIPMLPIGTHRLRWIIADICGNETYCDRKIVVESQIPGCVLPVARISGDIHTAQNQAVQFVNVNLDSSFPNGMQHTYNEETSASGAYQFNTVLPYGTNFSLTPTRSDNFVNGVTTYDIVLINQHLLGFVPFSSPYQYIAADANHSGSVTTFDIVEIRRLLLGYYMILPLNTSWRFVLEDYAFPDPQNPFSPPFPEAVNDSDLEPGDALSYPFIGIKIGDLNHSAVANGLQSTEDRSKGIAYLDAADQYFEKGAQIRVKFKAKEPIYSMQGALAFPGMQLEDIFPGFGMESSHFGMPVDGHSIRFSWDGPVARQPEFTLQMRAERAGKLSDLLVLDTYDLYPEVCKDLNSVCKLGLRFDGVTSESQTLQLLACDPNPFGQNVRIRFSAPEGESVALMLVDGSGRTVLEQSILAIQGGNVADLDLSALPPGQIYSLRLSCSTQTVWEKLVKME